MRDRALDGLLMLLLVGVVVFFSYSAFHPNGPWEVIAAGASTVGVIAAILSAINARRAAQDMHRQQLDAAAKALADAAGRDRRIANALSAGLLGEAGTIAGTASAVSEVLRGDARPVDQRFGAAQRLALMLGGAPMLERALGSLAVFDDAALCKAMSSLQFNMTCLKNALAFQARSGIDWEGFDPASVAALSDAVAYQAVRVMELSAPHAGIDMPALNSMTMRAVERAAAAE